MTVRLGGALGLLAAAAWAGCSGSVDVQSATGAASGTGGAGAASVTSVTGAGGRGGGGGGGHAAGGGGAGGAAPGGCGQVARAGCTLWAKELPYFTVQALTVGGEGSLYLAGVFTGTVDFGTGPLTAVDGASALLVKLSPAGDVRWARRVDGFAWADPFSLGVGVFGGPDLGALTSSELFVRHHAADGTLTSQAVVQGSFGPGAPVLASDRQGAFYLGGGTSFDPAFLRKYDAAGNLAWKKLPPPSMGHGGLTPSVVALGPEGDLLVAGEYEGSPDLGGGPLPPSPPGSLCLFAARFTGAGAHRWSSGLTCSGHAGIFGAAGDAGGGTFLTGSFSGQLATAAGTLQSAGQTDILLARLSPAGALSWARGWGAAGADQGDAVLADAAGNVLQAGTFEQAVDFGGGPLQRLDDGKFLLQRRPDGSHLWSRSLPINADAKTGLTPAGGAVMAGSFSGTVDFGTGSLVGDPAGHSTVVVSFAP